MHASQMRATNSTANIPDLGHDGDAQDLALTLAAQHSLR